MTIEQSLVYRVLYDIAILVLALAIPTAIFVYTRRARVHNNVQVRRKVAHREFGLKQQHPRPGEEAPGDEFTIDIVAIHGLDSQSPTAWTAWKIDGEPESGDVHWLKDPDMLPSRMSNSRIFTYDWPAGVGRDAPIASIFHHSLHLLSELLLKRKDPGTAKRPIVFVASCFGGLILAKALVGASETLGDRRFRTILRHTVGVVFLGTPFQGTDKVLHAATLVRIASAAESGAESSHELSKLLSHESDRGELDELVTKFSALKDSPGYSFPVMCFCETLPTDVGSIIKRLPVNAAKSFDKSSNLVLLVKSSSACLQGAAAEPLYVRHNMLNKFNSPDNSNYNKVLSCLEEFAEHAKDVIDEKLKNQEPENNYKTVGKWLALRDFFDDHKNFLSKHQPGTSAWFVNLPTFTRWVEWGRETLFCHGFSGAGKTIMSSFVIQHLVTYTQGKHGSAVAYIYCDGEKHAEQSAEALIRNIFRQVLFHLEEVPESASVLYRRYQRSPFPPSTTAIADALAAAMIENKLELYLVLDALDECDSFELDKLLESLFTIQHTCKLRILATAKHLPGVVKHFDHCPTVRISQPRDEILKYIEGTAKKVLQPWTAQDEEDLDTIKTAIASAADGMFLLARIYLESLSGLKRRDRRTALRNMTSTQDSSRPHSSIMADSVDEAYTKVLQRIKRQGSRNMEFAREILTWVLFARRPLTFSELQHAVTIREGDQTIEQHDLDTPERITFTCAGLIEMDAQQSHVRLIHSSARYFLQSNLHRISDQGRLGSRMDSTAAGSDFMIKAHERIAFGCIDYLMLLEFRTIKLHAIDQWFERLGSYPFYEYAADNWEYHAEMGRVAQASRITSFLDNKPATRAMHPIIPQWSSDSTEGEIPDQSVSFESAQMIQSWLKDCDDTHDHEVSHESIQKAHPLRLIDTRHKYVVSIPRPARNLRYAALSYTWGDGQDFPEYEKKMRHAEKEQQLEISDMPRVLVDAIAISHAVGIRYLWVDMFNATYDVYASQWIDWVFKHATLTIVAAQGDDCDAGLLSSSQQLAAESVLPSRHAIDSSHVVASTGLVSDASVIAFNKSLSQTLWGKRGWTLVESIFSRRLLVFTEHGTSLVCGSSLYTPSGTVPIGPGDLRPSRLHKVPPGRQFEAYLDIVREISTRDFRFQSDMLTALELIASDLGGYMDGQPNSFTGGVPTRGMEQILCWRSEAPNPRRNKELPSWNWLGWAGNPIMPKDWANNDHHSITTHTVVTNTIHYLKNKEKGATRHSPSRLVDMSLRLETVGVCLLVEGVDADAREGFRVWSPGDHRMIGKIQLSHEWREERKSREKLHFIPVATTIENDNSMRIKMLMCIEPVSVGYSRADVNNSGFGALESSSYESTSLYERVQVMDCDVSENEWKDLAESSCRNGHRIFLV